MVFVLVGSMRSSFSFSTRAMNFATREQKLILLTSRVIYLFIYCRDLRISKGCYTLITRREYKKKKYKSQNYCR